MSDKARELAIKLQLLSQHSRVMHSEWVSEATSLIAAALQAARLEAIEDCRDKLEYWLLRGQMGGRDWIDNALDALKEAK
jgi:hypothetical protein